MLLPTMGLETLSDRMRDSNFLTLPSDRLLLAGQGTTVHDALLQPYNMINFHLSLVICSILRSGHSILLRMSMSCGYIHSLFDPYDNIGWMVHTVSKRQADTFTMTIPFPQTQSGYS